MSIQTDIDSLVGGVSVFNLALNVAGIINNKRNVSLYAVEADEDGNITKTNVLEGSISKLGGITDIANKIDGTAIVMTADIVESCKLTEHPLEDGKVVADNKVILPTEINIRITLQAVEYQDKLDEIKRYKNERTMLLVETKFGTFPNMQIVEMPCNLNVENVNRLTFTIKLREVIMMTEEIETANDSDMDTVNTGTQTGFWQTLDRVVFG